MRKIHKALTIAGSDSGAGAGIQADLKTFAALGVYGTSAITAITAQNTRGVTKIFALDPELIAAQIDAVIQDIGADAVKTGMLCHAAIVEVVAEKIRRHRLSNLVVDPVMAAKSGDALLRADAIAALKSLLIPLAAVVTPNIPEAEQLTGVTGTRRKDLEEAARQIVDLGAKSVVIKGGHRKARRWIYFTTGKHSARSAPRAFGRRTRTAPAARSRRRSRRIWRAGKSSSGRWRARKFF